jgi:hypothetical protein
MNPPGGLEEWQRDLDQLPISITDLLIMENEAVSTEVRVAKDKRTIGFLRAGLFTY